MKIESRDGSRERRVLAGMVTDDAALARIASKWSGDYPFASRWANLVAGWCVDHHRRYGKAPNRGIVAHFEAWAQSEGDEDTVKLVERFLHGLSDEYDREDKINSAQLADVAEEHFNHVRLTRLIENLRQARDANDLKEAREKITAFNWVELGESAAIDVFQDEAAMVETFDRRADVLVEYPGALGHFFQSSFERDAFVAFQAQEKGAKSFMLLDVAYRSILNRHRVAYFQVGDLSRSQVLMRFYCRAAEHPYRSTNPDRSWPCIVKVPRKIKSPPKGTYEAEVTYGEVEFPKSLDRDIVFNSCQELYRRIRSKRPFLRLSCHPNRTINIDGIRSILQSWELGGWVPDVILIDYADILAPPAGAGRMDLRDQINTHWTQMRSLSQERHCLLVTATQADAGSYVQRTQDRKNFSEDKRKYAHVTAMFGINVTPSEKEKGLCRINLLAGRDLDWPVNKVVHVAQCLSWASPAMLSTF